MVNTDLAVATKFLVGCLISPCLLICKIIICCILGADYTPPQPPKLTISTTYEVTVGFMVAPKSYYIIKYFVTLRKAGNSKKLKSVYEVLNLPFFAQLYVYRTVSLINCPTCLW